MDAPGPAREAESDARLIDNLIRANSPLVKSVVEYAAGGCGADTVAATMGLGLVFVTRIMDRPDIQERIRVERRAWIVRKEGSGMAMASG